MNVNARSLSGRTASATATLRNPYADHRLIAVVFTSTVCILSSMTTIGHADRRDMMCLARTEHADGAVRSCASNDQA